MTTEEAVKMIKQMLFGKAEKFAEANLMDGTKITNNVEGDFEIGQTLYVIAEDGTLVLAPASQEHTMEDGTILVLDEASMIIEIKAAGADEAVEAATEEEVAMEEVVVETPAAVEGVITEDVVQAVIEALTPVVEEIKAIQEEMKKFRQDYDAFKQSEEAKPLNTKVETYSQSFADYRVEMLKKLKQK